MLSCIALLAGCAAAPSRDDPFEPMNRAMYAVHEVVDGNVVKPIAQAYVDYAPQLVRTGISNFFGNIDDFFSVINGMLQGKPDKAGNDLGRVMIEHRLRLARTDRHRVGCRHSERQRGLRPDVRRTGASRRDRTCSSRCSGRRRCATAPAGSSARTTTPIGYIPDVPTRNILWGIGYLDARASGAAGGVARRPGVARSVTRSSAARTCSGASIWCTTASRRRPKERRMMMTNLHSRTAARSRARAAHVSAALACCCSPSRCPRWRRKRPMRWSSACRRKSLQIIKTDPKVQAGDQAAHPRSLIETKLTAAFRFRRA